MSELHPLCSKFSSFMAGSPKRGVTSLGITNTGCFIIFPWWLSDASNCPLTGIGLLLGPHSFFVGGLRTPWLLFEYKLSGIAVTAAPVSSLKIICSPFIMMGFCQTSVEFSDCTTPKNTVSMLSVSSHWYISSILFFVLQTTAKWPFFLHFLHSASLAGQLFSECVCGFPHLPHPLLASWYLVVYFNMSMFTSFDSPFACVKSVCCFFISSLCFNFVMALLSVISGSNCSLSDSLWSLIPVYLLSFPLEGLHIGSFLLVYELQ